MPKSLHASEGLLFRGDTLTSCHYCPDLHIIIPSVTPDGVQVTTLDAYSVNGSFVREVTIPDTVKNIKHEAFDSIGIETIHLPASVTNIETGCIAEGCDVLHSIIVDPANPVYLSESNCVLERASGTVVAGCKASVIPESATHIAENAFENCPTVLNIPQNVRYVREYAFKTDSVEEIHVEPKNNYLRSENNCLINKENNELWFGCKNSQIPLGVESIREGAFFGNRDLKQIELPPSIGFIGNSAFSMTGLTSVEIPHSVSCIEGNPFSWSPLQHIEVDKDNATYYSKNDCLIQRASQQLRIGSENSIIPDGVSIIASQAFVGVQLKEPFEIPSSVNTIENYSFAVCSVHELTIPDTVLNIAPAAFELALIDDFTISKQTIHNIAANGHLNENSIGSLREYLGLRPDTTIHIIDMQMSVSSQSPSVSQAQPVESIAISESHVGVVVGIPNRKTNTYEIHVCEPSGNLHSGDLVLCDNSQIGIVLGPVNFSAPVEFGCKAATTGELKKRGWTIDESSSIGGNVAWQPPKVVENYKVNGVELE